MGKLSRHHTAADDDHALREVFQRGKCLVGVDAAKIGAWDIRDCRPRPSGSEDRVCPHLLVIDIDPISLQPAFGAIDDLDPGPAGLGVEDRGEFLLDLAHLPPDRRVRDSRDRVEDPEVLLGPGVLEEPSDVI